MFNQDMLNKLADLKKQTEESKERLEQFVITEESGGGLIEITMNGNRKVKSLKINTDVSQMDNEELEDLMLVAFERVLNKVNEVNEKEVMSSAQSLFPGF
jgi:DNA-binding YbaB/EbfC family protein